jgi:hypothetical protein
MLRRRRRRSRRRREREHPKTKNKNKRQEDDNKRTPRNTSLYFESGTEAFGLCWFDDAMR